MMARRGAPHDGRRQYPDWRQRVDAIAKAVVALVPALLLFGDSLLVHLRSRNLASVLQLAGSACAVLVVLTHLFEALHVFTEMQWGQERSAGHYLDLSCAILAATLFPIGYWLQVLVRRGSP